LYYALKVTTAGQIIYYFFKFVKGIILIPLLIFSMLLPVDELNVFIILPEEAPLIDATQ
jgi:hypothetical protein